LENAAVQGNWRRALLTLLWIAVAITIGVGGRMLLDWVVMALPTWSTEVEHVGGWLVGLLAGAVGLVPIFRMYGVFNKRLDGDR
jgi:hypothetical protein